MTQWANHDGERHAGGQFLANRHLWGLQAAKTHVEERECREYSEEAGKGVFLVEGVVSHGQPN
jgi:hypothetical protein